MQLTVIHVTGVLEPTKLNLVKSLLPNKNFKSHALASLNHAQQPSSGNVPALVERHFGSRRSYCLTAYFVFFYIVFVLVKYSGGKTKKSVSTNKPYSSRLSAHTQASLYMHIYSAAYILFHNLLNCPIALQAQPLLMLFNPGGLSVERCVILSVFLQQRDDI